MEVAVQFWIVPKFIKQIPPAFMSSYELSEWVVKLWSRQLSMTQLLKPAITPIRID